MRFWIWFGLRKLDVLQKDYETSRLATSFCHSSLVQDLLLSKSQIPGNLASNHHLVDLFLLVLWIFHEYSIKWLVIVSPNIKGEISIKKSVNTLLNIQSYILVAKCNRLQ